MVTSRRLILFLRGVVFLFLAMMVVGIIVALVLSLSGPPLTRDHLLPRMISPIFALAPLGASALVWCCPDLDCAEVRFTLWASAISIPAADAMYAGWWGVPVSGVTCLLLLVWTVRRRRRRIRRLEAVAAAERAERRADRECRRMAREASLDGGAAARTPVTRKGGRRGGRR